MAAHSYSALYYPFMHFKDERWLKLSALYWDRMARIVPGRYSTDDGHVVRELGDFIETLRPEYVSPGFGKRFVEFVEQRGADLRQRYGVEHREQWPPVPDSWRPPKAGGSSGSDQRMSYVFYEKMTDDLQRALYISGIALPDPVDPSFIGMHPTLAHVYMTALADQLARERGLHPVTDETMDHLATGGWTIERLAEALLPDVAVSETRSHEVESVAVHLAIENVLPRELNELPVDRILEFRAKYPQERARFQDYISAFVTSREWLNDIEDPAVLAERLQSEYAKEVKPQLDDLREKLHDVNIATVMGAVAIQINVPWVVEHLAKMDGVNANQVAALGAGAALALVPVLRDRRKAQTELRSSRLAYMMRIERDLRPRQVIDWIRQATRRFRGSRSTTGK